ncbi:facilitated trehalose transporter Tret1 [Cephus cinctus]|uniref:Facilitated trehalose transporter Tret1 n=1 Tax=Cephus cinctus TaxID=211228 RepID=A0AAJ7BVT8_CEPCN|nr:facilitated trehalose transporter Tret1 [Cephus cinctus]
MNDVNKVPIKIVKNIYWSQWLVASIACLLLIDNGLTTGWVSPYLARMTSSTSDMKIKLTDVEASWVVSIFNIGRIIGTIITVPMQDIIGRKKSLLISSVPLFFTWIFFTIANSVSWIYAARLCGGISSGILWSVLAVLLGEIADPEIRGAVIFLNVNACSVGTLIGNIMGPYVSLEVFSYVCLIPIILFVGLFILLPDSPYYYMERKDVENAEKSLKWYRRREDVKKELCMIQNYVEESVASNTFLSKVQEMWQPGNRKSAMILLSVNLFMNMAGVNTLNLYTEIIMKRSGISMTPSTVVIVIGVVIVLAGMMSSIFVDRFGRKSLLIASSLGVAVTHALLGLHFLLLSIGYDSNDLTWLPIITMILLNVFLYFGLYPIPSALVSEMFTSNVKTLASFGTAFSSSIFAFIISKTFQPFLDVVEEHYVYWTYGAIVFLGVPYTYFCIPETKGKNFLQIQELLREKT